METITFYSWDKLLLLTIAIFLVIFLVGIVPLTFFIIPTHRTPKESEKKYITVLPDGSTSEPRELPCWYDVSLEEGDDDEQLKETVEDKAMLLKVPGPSRIEPPEVFLSLVVPAFNEEKRLAGMLKEAVQYFRRELDGTTNDGGLAEVVNEVRLRKRESAQTNGKAIRGVEGSELKGWEILVVSDGSEDDTVNTALRFANDQCIYEESTCAVESSAPKSSVRVISLSENRGKGAAVTHGMRHVRGKYVIFADADGATKFEDLGKLINKCREIEDSKGRAVVVGSRAHLAGTEAVVKRSKFRNLLMKGFHAFIKFLTPKKTRRIRDTQCGFKLFTRESLVYIIPFMISEGWIFDVEMLMHAEAANIPFAEVPVDWHEIPGSKLNALQASFGMAFGLIMLRYGWFLGTFTIKQGRH